MLLDVLTLLGALYVILTIVEYLCSLLKSPRRTAIEASSQQQSPEVGISDISGGAAAQDVCDRRGGSRNTAPPETKPKIQYIIMTSEVRHQQAESSDLDQYQSEILKRRKRIAAGEVKGFYLAANAGSSEGHETNYLEGGTDQLLTKHGDQSYQRDHNRHRSLTREVQSCDESSVGMVGVKKSSDIGYYIDTGHWSTGKEAQKDRRTSLDTAAPTKLIAPVTVIKSGSGSPFRISENSAFTPIKPRREASVECRPGLLSVSGGPVHAQSFPDVSVDSGVNTATSTASSSSAMSTTKAAAQITVVMRPTSDSEQGKEQRKKATSSLLWLSSENKSTEGSSGDFHQRTVIQVPGTDSKVPDRPVSPVRLKMVQTNAFKDPSIHSKLAPVDIKGEPEAPVKLRITEPVDEEKSRENHRRPYFKSSTTTLASTAALARAGYNKGSNYYSNLPSSFENVPGQLRQQSPPLAPPPASTELLTPQLLKKHSSIPLGDWGLQKQGTRQYYNEQPQMALTRAMRTTIPHQKMSTNEPALPQPYHPPTMASYETLGPPPVSPGVATRPSDATLFAFCGSSAGLEPDRHSRQQKRTRYSPGPVQYPYQEVRKQDVIWRPREGRTGVNGGSHHHSLSVDEGIRHERSRSSDRSRIRRYPQAGFPSDDSRIPHLPKAATVDYYHDSREITDQGVPANEDVLKGGNVSSKTKMFEALAEQEFHDLDPQRNKSVTDRPYPVPPANVGGSFAVPKQPKKMERSHTVHTVRSLMAPDAYQYENAPYSQRNPYSSYFDQENNRLDEQPPPPSPRHVVALPHNGHVITGEEVIEFPPASISPRSVQREQAVIGKGHQFQQAQMVQPPAQTKPQVWNTPPAETDPQPWKLHADPRPRNPPASQPDQQPWNQPAPQARNPPPQPHSQVWNPPSQPHQWTHSSPSSRVQIQVPQVAVQPSTVTQVSIQPAMVTIQSVAQIEGVKQEIQLIPQMEKRKQETQSVPLLEKRKQEVQPVPQLEKRKQETQLVPQPEGGIQPVPGFEKGNEEETFEDEMSKMSIADKAKLFEQKAEEQAQSQKKRYNAARHKTQPVTTSERGGSGVVRHSNGQEEVMKARSVISDQSTKSMDNQGVQKSGHKREAESEKEDEGTKYKTNVEKSSRVISHQRVPEKAKSVTRSVESTTTEQDAEQSSGPSLKPRRVVYLHSNGTGDELQQVQSTDSVKKAVEPTPAVDDPNNNDKVTTKSIDSSVPPTHSLVNGREKPSPVPRSRLPKLSSISYKVHVKTVDGRESMDSGLYTGPVVVKEKEKKYTFPGHASGRPKVTNGQEGQLFSRILVNANDDDDEEARNIAKNGLSQPGPNSGSTRNEPGNEVDPDSFMSIIREPVIRLPHFRRPKPNRRHSTCGSRRMTCQEDEEKNEEKSSIVLVCNN